MLRRKNIIDNLRKLPEGLIIHHPFFEQDIIIGKEDFDEMIEEEGRWISGVNNNSTGICYIMTYEDLSKAFTIK